MLQSLYRLRAFPARFIIKLCRQLLCLSALWICVPPSLAQIGGLEFRGAVSFSEHGKDLRFEFDEIANIRLSGTSGALRVALWLTDVPYAGGLLRGEELADLRLDSLQASTSHVAVAAIAELQGYPDKGTYYPVFVLYEEKDRWDEEMVDWMTFNEPVSFGQAVFEGGAHIRKLGTSFLQVNLDGVRSERPVGSIARPLRIVLKAYESPTPNLFDFPHVVTVIDLPTVSPGNEVTDLSLERMFLRPDDGIYYLFLTLQEFLYGRWVDGDELSFSDPWILQTPIPEISVTRVSASTLLIDWSVEPGYRYTLQASIDLSNWANVGDDISVRSGDPSTLSKTVFTQTETRYYRVVVEPLIF